MRDLHLSHRTISLDDRAFLFQLYASTRAEELAAWGWTTAQQETFLQMQFQAQQQSYQTMFPERDQQIVMRHKVPIGAIQIVRQPIMLHLVDFALLPEYRNQGIGTALLQQLCAEATQSQKRVQLNVLQSNRAIRLYQRFGFVPIEESEVYCLMEWGASELVSA